jgi:putative transposase
LFKSYKGIFIHADVNGAYQMMKKGSPNTFVDGEEGVGLHPVKLKSG